MSTRACLAGFLAAVALGCFVAIGCSTATGEHPVADSGVESGADSGTNTGVDSGADGGAERVLTTLASGQNKYPKGIAVDATNVYWVTGDWNTTDGTVMKCAISGCGGSPTSLATGQASPFAIAVDATSVYWTNGSGVNGGLMKCAIGGCGGIPTILNSAQDLRGVAVDETSVYWTSVSGQVAKLAVDGGSSMATGQGATFAIAVDGTNVYWASYTAGTVMKCAKEGCGGNPTTLASGQNPDKIAVDGTNVYWTGTTNMGGGAYVVLKCDASGCGGNPTILASYPTGTFLGGLAADATSVYWGLNHSVVKCAKEGCGGIPTILASDESTIGASELAVDTTSAYWTNTTSGAHSTDAGVVVTTEVSVMKLTPK